MTGDLHPDDIGVIFREFLGRDATQGDIEFWIQFGTLRAFLDGVLASEEYKQRLARRERAQTQIPLLNCWIEGWERFNPCSPGSRRWRPGAALR